MFRDQCTEMVLKSLDWVLELMGQSASARLIVALAILFCKAD